MGSGKFLIIFLFPYLLYSQNTIGILCTDVKIRNNHTNESAIFRQVLESVLSNLKYPPIIIEREKLSDIIEKIQEEQNLQKDFNGLLKKPLASAQVDYIAYGNFSHTLGSEFYEFQLEFVKVSGENALSKRVSPILRFTEKDLSSNTKIFEVQLNEMLQKYSFLNGIGIVESEQLSEINRRIDEKDQQIETLSKVIRANREKEDSIVLLKNTFPQIEFELAITDHDLVILITFKNKVPIKMKPFLSFHGPWECDNTDKKYPIFNTAAHVLNEIKIYPPINNDKYRFVFDSFNDGELPLDKLLCMRMEITYASIYEPEIQKPELKEKTVAIDYLFDLKNFKFIKTKFKEKD